MPLGFIKTSPDSRSIPLPLPLCIVTKPAFGNCVLTHQTSCRSVAKSILPTPFHSLHFPSAPCASAVELQRRRERRDTRRGNTQSFKTRKHRYQTRHSLR